ncbi:hypothetical protein HanRHA438_Chr06g0278271 [Helianthus annuus]|uniref:Uncharacterized protein n=1 Tax=Helianthus annuus TaxID=4232 RepID=A0A9K3NK54_HELAN|nr:hypothetical protein HanXRQr2_Chr06g0269021 [Helianthus annuus]KAJ0912790.1 hypothetical protein HanRHA438_Chr06g0278271 [Helianthus annuus]KAJ0916263.1 hypothetical protein HanPSC8_Chr06g0259661 [Helianthus annuus]
MVPPLPPHPSSIHITTCHQRHLLHPLPHSTPLTNTTTITTPPHTSHCKQAAPPQSHI